MGCKSGSLYLLNILFIVKLFNKDQFKRNTHYTEKANKARESKMLAAMSLKGNIILDYYHYNM